MSKCLNQLKFALVCLSMAIVSSAPICLASPSFNQENTESDSQGSGKNQCKTIILFGYIEKGQQPEIEQFELLIREDCSIPCPVKFSLDRLTRVAHDERMRITVWKRMQLQELRFTSGAVLKHVEELALACDMPIR